MAMSVQSAAAYFLGWRYAGSTQENRFPVQQGCIPSTLVINHGQEKRIDCSSFMVALACYAYAGRVQWDADAYSDLQVMDVGRLWSAVDCWERHQLGTRLPTLANRHNRPTVTTPARGWGFYQAWVDTDPAEIDGDPIGPGHQFAYHGGMGVRMHSSSDEGCGPVWERISWAELVEYYAHGIQGIALQEA